MMASGEMMIPRRVLARVYLAVGVFCGSVFGLGFAVGWAVFR